MEQIFTIFVSFLIILSGSGDCYELPNGLTVKGNLNRDGYMYITDDFDNGLSVTYLKNIDMQAEINRFKNNQLVSVIEELNFNEITKLKFDNSGPIDPYDAILLVSRDIDLVLVYMYNQGEPSTHKVFEEKSLQFARSFVQGGRDAAYRSNCSNNSRWTWDVVWQSQR